MTGFEGNDLKTRILYRFEEKGEVKGRIMGEHVRINGIVNTDKLVRAGIK